jgi:hypothetical protein
VSTRLSLSERPAAELRVQAAFVRLDSFDVVYLGHGWPFDRARLREIAEEYLRDRGGRETRAAARAESA